MSKAYLPIYHDIEIMQRDRGFVFNSVLYIEIGNLTDKICFNKKYCFNVKDISSVKDLEKPNSSQNRVSIYESNLIF